MPILRDVDFNLTTEQLLAEQRHKGHQPSLVAAAEKAIALAQPLYAPAIVYDEFETCGIAGHRIKLSADGAGLTIGPKADLLAPAEWLQTAVYTIGPALEATVSELARAGKLLLSYLLDCAGVLALGSVGERLRILTAEKAAERGWRVSPALSPGSLVGWSLTGQRELCRLLPIADIGVRLNRYCVLKPQKSASVVIGMGRGYESHEVGSVCDYCSLRDSCWRRRGSTA